MIGCHNLLHSINFYFDEGLLPFSSRRLFSPRRCLCLQLLSGQSKKFANMLTSIRTSSKDTQHIGKLLTLSPATKPLDLAVNPRINEYLFSKIDMQIKLVTGNSAGTVTAYYVSLRHVKCTHCPSCSFCIIDIC